METFILFQKTIFLKRNKWSALSIPVLFNSSKDDFIVEAPDYEISGTVIEFELKATNMLGEQSNIIISLPLGSDPKPVSIASLDGINSQEYLLLACRSVHDGPILLSIRRK